MKSFLHWDSIDLSSASEDDNNDLPTGMPQDSQGTAMELWLSSANDSQRFFCC